MGGIFTFWNDHPAPGGSFGIAVFANESNWSFGFSKKSIPISSAYPIHMVVWT